MRARIRTLEFTLEFDGEPSIWNDLLRPVLGGPEAAPDARAPEPIVAPPARTAPTSHAPTTHAPAGPATPASAPTRAAAPAPAQVQEPPAVAIEPCAEPRELYRRLTEAGGRRSEKDAVVAAVWFVGGTGGDATPEEVQQHLLEYDAFPDARVKPVMLKHVSRSHLLEKTERKNAVRLTEKGRQYVRSRLVGV